MFYLRPHNGEMAVGPFTTTDDAITWYHANMNLAGCDVIQFIDPSAWPTPGNSLVFRFEFEEPALQAP